MKSKFKSAAIMLAAILLLAGCKEDTESEHEVSAISSGSSAAASQTTAASSINVTTAKNTETTPAEPASLLECTVNQLKATNLDILYTGEDIFDGNLYDTKICSADTAEVTKQDDTSFNYVRKSSFQLKKLDGADAADFVKICKANKFEPSSENFSQNMSIDYFDPIIKFNNITAPNVSDPLKIGETETLLAYNVYGGKTTNGAKFNAFVRTSPENANLLEVIIDPAYMYGLPTYTTDVSQLTYNINGTKILADTIKFYIDKSSLDTDDSALADAIKSVSDNKNYVYASVTANFSCLYSTTDGFITPEQFANRTNDEISTNEMTGWLFGLDVITTDTDAAISTAYSIKSDNTDAGKIYDTIMNNKSTLLKSNTCGLALLDLDSDGTPELLASDYEKAGEDYVFDDNIDTRVYRIRDGKLVYIDTLYNSFLHFYKSGNVLGQKLNDDGSSSWFTMSRLDRSDHSDKDVDYLFDLKGDKLVFKEIFKTEDILDKNGEFSDTKYYYLGKPFEYKTKKGISNYGEETDIYYYGNIEADSGLFELFGFVQQDYASRLAKKYDLNSDWLFNVSDTVSGSGSSDEVTFASPDERTIGYSIAYIVDSFYGNNASTATDYEYVFLGDYEKPVIYLYPQKKTDVSVKVNLKNGELSCTYPEYGNGWNVEAYPDGTLINKADGQEYSYLYWEGKGEVSWDMSDGFVVKGSDTAEFLREKLSYMGLTPKEYNEFIVYWLPQMQNNKYNLIKFQTSDYEKLAQLDISPKPDSVLRIFMTYIPLEEEISVPEQQLKRFERKGFTVVEWGGGGGGEPPRAGAQS